LQTSIRTEGGFLGLAPPCGLATLCTAHCSTCVAQDMHTVSVFLQRLVALSGFYYVHVKPW